MDGHDDLMVYRAKCCNPVRGEEIIGYITRGKGIAVHAKHCSNVQNLLYDADRRIDVEWVGPKYALYSVKLALVTEDRQGMLADVTAAIAGVHSNIQNIEARTGDNRANIDVTVDIVDVEHMEKIISSLTKNRGRLSGRTRDAAVVTLHRTLGGSLEQTSHLHPFGAGRHRPLFASDSLRQSGFSCPGKFLLTLTPGTSWKATPPCRPRACCRTSAAILEAAGSSLGQVLKTTVYLKDLADFAMMNEVYARFFGDCPPARATVEVARLPRNVSVEIELIAEVEG